MWYVTVPVPESVPVSVPVPVPVPVLVPVLVYNCVTVTPAYGYVAKCCYDCGYECVCKWD